MNRTGHLLLISFVFSFCHRATGQTLHFYGHSHNDYLQAKPLMDALDKNLKSVEADLHYQNGKLILSHNRWKLKKKPQFEDSYLKILDSLVTAHGGTVYKNDTTQLMLLVEFKSRKKRSFRQFIEMIHEYEHLFQKRLEDNTIRHGPVLLCITGNPPKDLWVETNSPYLYFDARIGRSYPPMMIEQTISMNTGLRQLFSRRKLKRGDVAEIRKIKHLTKRHYSEQIRYIRFWKCGNHPRVWASLIEADVNLMNVDDLNRYESFRKNLK